MPKLTSGFQSPMVPLVYPAFLASCDSLSQKPQNSRRTESKIQRPHPQVAQHPATQAWKKTWTELELSEQDTKALKNQGT